MAATLKFSLNHFMGLPCLFILQTSNAGGTCSIPCRGIKIPHVVQHSQKINKSIPINKDRTDFFFTMLRIQIKYLLGVYSVQGSMTKLEEILQVRGTFSVSLNYKTVVSLSTKRLSEHRDPLLAKTKIDSELPTSEDLLERFTEMSRKYGAETSVLSVRIGSFCLSPLPHHSFVSRGRSFLLICTLLVASTQPQFLRTTLPKSRSHPPEPAYIGTLNSGQLYLCFYMMLPSNE